MDDITIRALKTLKDVASIIAEDTRSYRILAARHGIPNKPVYSLYKGNESARVEQILPDLQGGLEAALVSECGTPAVYDPGALLVRRCLESGVSVVPIPGPSSLTALLSVAGIFSGDIVFLAFLPKKHPVKEIIRVLESRSVAVFFEHPRRFHKTIKELYVQAGSSRMVLGREMTKHFEEIWSGTVDDAKTKFEGRVLKGEIAVMVEPPAGRLDRTADEIQMDQQRLRETLLLSKNANVPLSSAVRQIAREMGLPKRDVYALALKVWESE